MATELARYGELLRQIKLRISGAQSRAMLAVNAELVRLYWDIGVLIATRQAAQGWGAGVIPRLAQDLRNELPDLKGFSERNLKLMVQFAQEYPDLFQIGQRAVAQLGAPDAAPPQLGNRPLPKFPGRTTCCSSRRSRTDQYATGTPVRPCNTVGAAIPSQRWSVRTRTRARVPPSRTSPVACRTRSPL
jgi:hypothetical protein